MTDHTSLPLSPQPWMLSMPQQLFEEGREGGSLGDHAMMVQSLDWRSNTSTTGMGLNYSGTNNTTSLEYGLSTGEDQDAGPAPLLWSSIIAGIALCVIITMTICGNILVIVAIIINPHLRITTNYFILNLAIADLLLGTTVLPFSASLEVVNRWIFGQFVCNIWAALDVLCCTASIMSLCVISIDRYIGVTRPLQHSNIMTEKRAVIIIVVVWVLATAISVAPLAGWKEPPPEDPTICEVTKKLGYVLFSVSGSFYIPLIIILVVYYRVYREASKQSRFLSTGTKTTHSDSGITLRVHTGKPKEENSFDHELPSSLGVRTGNRPATRRSYGTLAGKVAKFKREKKAAKTLGIVVGVFILCWFPFFFILPLEALCTSCNVPAWLFKIIFWLGYCNSTMNPIIYACSSREFKRAFIRVLLCRCRRRFPAYITNTSKGYRTKSRLARMKGAMKLCTRGQSSRIKKTHSYRGTHTKDNTICSSQSANKLNPQTAWSNPSHSSHMVRKETMDSLVISDDESAIHEFSSSESEGDGMDDGLLMRTNRENNNYQCHLSEQDATKIRFKDMDAVIYSNRGTADVIIEDNAMLQTNGIQPHQKIKSRNVSASDSELYNRSHMYLCSHRHKKYNCGYSAIKQEDTIDHELPSLNTGCDSQYRRERLSTVPNRAVTLKGIPYHIEVNPDAAAVGLGEPGDLQGSICASQETVLSAITDNCDVMRGPGHTRDTGVDVNSAEKTCGQQSQQSKSTEVNKKLDQGTSLKKVNYVSVPIIVIDPNNGTNDN